MLLRKKLLVTVFIGCITGLFLALSAEEVFLSLSRRPEYFRELPNNILVITAKDIQKTSPSNLAELLQKQTLIYASKQGTHGSLSTISLRGMPAADVLVLVDGHPLNSISLGTADLSSISLNNVERIEIIRGPASAIYGFGASGGVINIITKKLTPEKLNLNLNYGSFNTFNTGISLGKQSGNHYYNFSGSKIKSSGQRKNSDYENNDFSGKFGIDNSEYNLNLSGEYFNSNLGVPGKITVGPNSRPLTVDDYDGNIENSATSPLARQKDERIIWQGQYKKYLPSAELILNLFHRYNHQNYIDPNPDWFTDNSYFEQIYKPQVIYNWKNLVILGVETQSEKYIYKDNAISTTKVDRWRNNFSLFYEQRIAIEKIIFRPSLRYDNNSAFGDVLSPQLSVVWLTPENFSLAQKVSLNIGQSWRAPSFDELYWPLEWYKYKGNPDLKPEKTIGGDIGVSREGKISYQLNYYFNQTENKIQNYTENPGLPTELTYPKNIARATSEGIETTIKHKINQYLSQQLDYNYTWAIDEDTKELLIYQPINRLGYTLTTELKNFSVSLSGNFVDKQKTEDGTTLPEYFLLSSNISFSLSENLRFYILADNILDKKYQNRAGYPLPGRTLTIGLNLLWY